ncbi:MAG: hypothetical protein AAFV25_13615 [Bacteroidota bacterium]
MALRDNFPEQGSNYMSGTSDGYEYRTTFGGSTLESSYEMLRQFLREEGYANVPVPETVEDLLMFNNPVKNRQIILFQNYGYVHNPIKIFFYEGEVPKRRRKVKSLTLCIYDEAHPRHLTKFHEVEAEES